MIGTFYRSASPDKPLFVNVAMKLSTGTVLCIIEAMKLLTKSNLKFQAVLLKYWLIMHRRLNMTNLYF